ncbi:hypothetical protein SAMN05445756_0163 [Kytococcus aerolatus]|uniref:DUF4177 domain-containing protein n=1 Tax=Kytococcus aerolatus TaxID=592308 RepID=A0A212T232_9MICO|nr:DUF5703 family protein [Kytococcus aerolatus]SNC59891.1 hypothetical protein SAMN05445756_0163 [Kytococcus aerolatus]
MIRPPEIPSAHRKARAAAVWEYRTVHADRDMSRSDLRRLLAEMAEYEGWTLHRVALYHGGGRRVSLRRKKIKVQRTV